MKKLLPLSGNVFLEMEEQERTTEYSTIQPLTQRSCPEVIKANANGCVVHPLFMIHDTLSPSVLLSDFDYLTALSS